MAKEIKTEILVNATPEKVWSIFTDFENYPKWNPFIKSLNGQVAPGQKLKVRIEPPGMKGMTMQPIVLDFEKNRKFRWIGHLFIKGLFDGEHCFELLNNGNGTTTFIQSEKFYGILVPLFKKMLDKNTLNGFKMMNEKLKEFAETDQPLVGDNTKQG